jgi:hypothetical protein
VSKYYTDRARLKDETTVSFFERTTLGGEKRRPAELEVLKLIFEPARAVVDLLLCSGKLGGVFREMKGHMFALGLGLGLGLGLVRSTEEDMSCERSWRTRTHIDRVLRVPQSDKKRR